MDLRESNPPAWALGEGYALNSIALTAQIMQQQYQENKVLTQMQGSAAQGEAAAAYNIYNQESEEEVANAKGQIANAGMQGLGVVASIGASAFINRGEINKTQAQISNAEAWEDHITKVRSNDPAVQANFVASRNAPNGQPIETDSIRNADGSVALTDLNKNQIATLYDEGNGRPAFETLAKNVSQNKKTLNDKLNNLNGERSTWENRLNTVFGSIGQATQGGLAAKAAQLKQEEANMQAGLKLASFNTQALITVSGIINTVLNQEAGIETSISENQINGLAASNRVN